MGSNDHMPTEEDFTSIAIQAGAIKVCPFHTQVTINQCNEKATRHAYAIATNKWKSDDLIGERESIMDGIKEAIDMAADECPVCEGLEDTE
jgi:hypothetical protein